MTASAGGDKNLVLLRDLIVNDPVALAKWPQVTDHIVKGAADIRRIKTMMLVDHNFAEAVLQSLQLWFSNGIEADLIQILRAHGLNTLADQAQEVGTTPKSSQPLVWFQVGEVVPNFSGREPQLKELHEKLIQARNSESTIANIICVNGLGGVGKSTLVRKYAFRNKEFFVNAAWIHAETPDSMKTSFVKLAKYLGVPVDVKEPNEKIRKKVFLKLVHQNLLLIFDNVEDKLQLKEFLPTIECPNDPTVKMPYILITSRRTDLVPDKNQLILDVWSLEEAVEFIQAQITSPSRQDVDRLATTLQQLPLALQQAVAYILDVYLIDARCIRQYLEQFEKCSRELLNDKRFEHESGYSMTTLTTWLITLARIRGMDQNQDAISLIVILSYLSPDFISQKFITEVLKLENADASMKLLNRFSMIGINAEMVNIHRLVQRVIRLQFFSSHLQDGASPMEKESGLLEAITGPLEVQLNMPEHAVPELVGECVSHALHLFNFQIRHPENMKTKANHFNRLCACLLDHQNYSACLKIAQQSAQFYEEIDGMDHNRIQMKIREAEAYRHQLNYAEAMQILDSVLPIAKSKLGHEHQVVLHVLDAMAITYTVMGELQKAVDIYDEIIPLQARFFAYSNVPWRAFVLGTKHNKGHILDKLGRHDEAAELWKYVYAKKILVYGKYDLTTLSTLWMLAENQLSRGYLNGALKTMKGANVGFQQVLGKSHPKVIETRTRTQQVEAYLASRYNALQMEVTKFFNNWEMQPK